MGICKSFFWKKRIILYGKFEKGTKMTEDLESKTAPEVKGYDLITSEEFYSSRIEDCLRILRLDDSHGCSQYFYKLSHRVVKVEQSQ